jgi:hypothetical protein
MVIAIESLLFLLAGIALAVVLVQIFGRGEQRRPATVRLVRWLKPAEAGEETRLLINDLVVLTVSNEGLRLADYADEVERLETIATRIATALGGRVELARLEGKAPAESADAPLYELPRRATVRRADQAQ